MDLRIANDGKGKNYSWEAWFNDSGHVWSVSARGYGSTEQEAREDLAQSLDRAAEACKANVCSPNTT